MTALSAVAKQKGIRFFLIAYTDLFGILRAKLVPASAIDGMAEDGAGFAGFATWFDMTPADPDILAIPDASSLIQLPWKPEVGWMAADLVMDGKPVEQAPRHVLRQVVAQAATHGLEMRVGVEPEFFLIQPNGEAIADGADVQGKPCYDQLTLMRRYDVIAEISDAMEALGWGPYQNDHEDANGQYRDELGVRARARDGRPARVFQIHGSHDCRPARDARDLYAQAVCASHRLRMPRTCVGVAGGGERVSGR